MGIKILDDGTEHLKGKSDIDVTLVWFRRFDMRYLPSLEVLLNQKYQDVRALFFDASFRDQKSHLNLLAREDYPEFKKLYKLEVINFNEHLNEMPAHFLRHASNLRDFYANGNSIELIPEDLFAYSPNLNAVDLKNNKIKVLPENLFAKNPKMTHIFLSSNNIAKLPAHLLRWNPLMVEFTAHGNAIEFIPDEFYENTPLIQKKVRIFS